MLGVFEAFLHTIFHVTTGLTRLTVTSMSVGTGHISVHLVMASVIRPQLSYGGPLTVSQMARSWESWAKTVAPLASHSWSAFVVLLLIGCLCVWIYITLQSVTVALLLNMCVFFWFGLVCFASHCFVFGSWSLFALFVSSAMILCFCGVVCWWKFCLCYS